MMPRLFKNMITAALLLFAGAILVLKRQWLAVLVTFCVSMLFPISGTETIAGIAVCGIAVAFVIGLLARCGVLCFVTGASTFYVLDLPYTPDVSNWVFTNTLAPILVVTVAAVYGAVVTVRPAPVRRVA